MNLLFCINPKFRPLLCQCLRSIVKNGGEENYDAYILHSDLSGEDMAAVQAVSPRVRCTFLTVNPKNPRHDLAWVRENTVILHFCGKNRPKGKPFGARLENKYPWIFRNRKSRGVFNASRICRRFCSPRSSHICIFSFRGVPRR